jgi:hypothetical protein
MFVAIPALSVLVGAGRCPFSGNFSLRSSSIESLSIFYRSYIALVLMVFIPFREVTLRIMTFLFIDHETHFNYVVKICVLQIC